MSETNTIPGEWRVTYYGSGTVTVSDGRLQATKYGVRSVGPHIGIHYRPHPSSGASETTDSERLEIAKWLAGILNGIYDNRHLMQRTGETTGTWKGVEFSAIGPHVDRDPPHCIWFQDESWEAKTARARLVDRLFGIGE